MPKVTFRNILDERSEFVELDKNRLIPLCYTYAKQQDNVLYDLIVNQKVSIFINDKLILPDDWIITELEENDKVIITPIIAGGKGGILKILIGVAILAVAWWNPAAILGVAAEGAKFATWQTIFMGLGASLALGGISELLFRPDLPSLPSYSGFKQTQTYNWQGIQTTAKYGTSIPIVYGTHKVGGNLISAFTESPTKTSNYLYMLIALCEGEIEGICQENDHTSICSTTDRTSTDYENPAILINDQPLSHYNDIEWWYRTGTNTPGTGSIDIHEPTEQNKIPYFDGIREQRDDGREITTDGITYTTIKDVDMIDLKLYSPALYQVDQGDVVARTEHYKVEYKVNGTGTWYTIEDDVLSEYWSPTTSGPSGHLEAIFKDGNDRKYWKPEEWYVWVRKNTLPDNLEDAVEPSTAGSVTIEGEIEIDCYSKDVPGRTKSVTLTPSVTYTYEWKTETYYGAGNTGPYFRRHLVCTNTQHHTPSFEIGEFKITVGTNIDTKRYSVSLEKNSEEIEGEWIPFRGKSTSGFYDSLVLDFNKLTHGNGVDTYDIRITRKNPKSDSSNIQNKITLSSVTEVIQGDFIYPNTALLGLRIKATGQISGNLPNITTILKGKKIEVPEFDEATSFNDAFYDTTDERWEDEDGNALTWDNLTYVEEYSNNAMLCVRDLLLEKRYGLGNYITTNDLYTSGLIEAIQTCHKPYRYYYTEGHDFLSWWDGGEDSDWSKQFRIMTYGEYATVDKSARTIAFDHDFGDYSYKSTKIRLRLNEQLNLETQYKLSFTLSDITRGNISEIVVFSLGGGIYTLNTETGTGAGDYEIFFSPNIDNINGLILDIRQENGLKFTISSLSLIVTSEKIHYHTWDGVLDGQQSALAALFEMCDSFRCWPVWYNGKFNFVIDEDDTPIHTITMGNMISGSFNQSFTPISEIPSTLVGQFADRNNRYELNTILVKSSDTTLNPIEKTIGLKGITSRHKAERELIWKLNKVTNCTHSVNFKTGLDYMHAMAGDIVNVSHTLPSWGESGRVLDYNSTQKQITLDHEITISNAATDTYLIRYQDAENDFLTATVNTATLGNGDYQEIYVENWATNYPREDAIYAVGNENTYIKEYRVTNAKRTTDNIVEISGIEHLSSLYSSDPNITIVEDDRSELPDILDKPPIPKVLVRPLDPDSGAGFDFSIDYTNTRFLKETVIQMSKSGEPETFDTILTAPYGQSEIRYKDNTLEVPYTYYFRIYHRNNHTDGDILYTTCHLKKEEYTLDPPAGIKIKDESPNSNYFDDMDIHLTWNDIKSDRLMGYVVEVVDNNNNILRTETITSPEYVYTYHDNVKDNDGTASVTSRFRIYSQASNYTISKSFAQKNVTNNTPDAVSNLTAEPIVGGVKFSWNKSQELDHKSYYYRTKVSSGSWSSWKETTDNTLVYSLSDSEITSYTDRAQIQIQVMDRDWYLQTSSAQDASAYANRISDNIFKLVASNSGGSGDVDDLYDGNKSSGGITF